MSQDFPQIRPEAPANRTVEMDTIIHTRRLFIGNRDMPLTFSR